MDWLDKAELELNQAIACKGSLTFNLGKWAVKYGKRLLLRVKVLESHQRAVNAVAQGTLAAGIPYIMEQ